MEKKPQVERIIIRNKDDKDFDIYIELAVSETGKLLVMYNKGMEVIKVEYTNV